MQAIILAAGMGRRLGKLTEDNTKCMLEVNGYKLIDRSLNALKQVGINNVVIVLGYKGDNVKNYLSTRYGQFNITFIDNPIYDKTNNIYSLYLAKDYLCADDTILLESDLIFDDSVLSYLLDCDYPNLALVDKYEGWMDGTVVTLDDDNRINNFIAKSQFNYTNINQYYKTVNIYKFSKSFSTSHYVPFLEAYCYALGHNEYYEQVLKVIALLERCPLKALPLKGQKWYEIDDIQDLDIASSIFRDKSDDRFKAISNRYGGYWRYPQMIDFCYLVNPYFPPQKMLDEMLVSYDMLLRSYPSGMEVNCLLAAKCFSVSQEYLVVGNGAAELIKSIISKLDGKVGTIFPTFEEYSNRCSEDRLIRYIPDNSDFEYSADDVINFFCDKQIDVLILINPDNPSGNYIGYSDLLRLIEWTRSRNIRCIIDESFVDFAESNESITLLRDEILCNYLNLVVVKSISKSYGVPGLRLGILASGDITLINSIKKDVAIWNINSFAEYFLQIYDKYHIDYLDGCQLFKIERNKFLRELRHIPWLRVIPSQANYFLCEIINNKISAKELAACLLSDFNILIKDCSNKQAFNGRNYVRIAIRNRDDNSKLVEALKCL